MKTYEDGIRDACETMHKHCLKKGIEVSDHIPYTEMIVFLNNEFGHLRKYYTD